MAKFHDKYWNRDGSAKRCYVCISPRVKTKITGLMDGYGSETCEYEEVCEKCGTRLAYWAYGSYDPCWLMAMLTVWFLVGMCPVLIIKFGMGLMK